MSEQKQGRPMTKAEKVLVWSKAILKTCNAPDMIEMKRNNPGLFRSTVTDKYLPFMERYPTLFNSIIDNSTDFDMKTLENLLSKAHKVENKEMTYEEANMKVGKAAYLKHLKPVLDKQGKKIDVYSDVELDDSDKF